MQTTDQALILPTRTPRRGAGSAALAQIRVLYALLLRDIRTRHGNTVLGYLRDLIQMPIVLAAMYIIFRAMGRQPPFGDSLLMFFATGVIPFYLVRHVAKKGQNAVKRAGQFKMMLPVTPLDVALSGMIVDVITNVVVFVGFFTMMAVFEASHYAVPYAPWAVVEGMFWLTVLAMGLGIINSVISFYIASWPFFFNMAMRPLLLTSGLFFVAEEMPPVARDLLALNPILHGIAWVRTGFYQTYPTFVLDKTYLVVWASLALLLGLALDRASRSAFGRRKV